MSQAQKYDENGKYVRYWLPELEKVPDEYIHEPHRMSIEQQGNWDVVIGDGGDYPAPMIDLEASYKRIRNNR